MAITLILPFLYPVRLANKVYSILFAHISSELGDRNSRYPDEHSAFPLVGGLNGDASIELDLQVLDIANPALQY